MKIIRLILLPILISCASTAGKTNFDVGNDCARMKLWDDEYLTQSIYEKKGGIPTIRGMTADSKLRVIVVGNPSPRLTAGTVRKYSAKSESLFEAKRKVIEIIKNEFHSSPHGPGIEGIEVFYRGKSYSGSKGSKEFSTALKNISDSGRIICEVYDKSDRCLIIYEADLRPLDGGR